MTLLLNNSPFENQPWVDALAELLPDLPVQVFPDIPDPAAIRYAAIWDHPHHDLLNYPNLQAILVLGAGMDLIDQQPELPDVPIVRLVDPAVGLDMAQYVLYWTMHFQRTYERYRHQQVSRQWQRHATPRSVDFRVSVLGLGLIGSEIASYLSSAGFQTQGWSRGAKTIGGVDCHVGDAGLQKVLANADVLVNCLPLTAQTRGLLNLQALSQLPAGAAVISVSRGAVFEEDAMVALLERGHLSGAALDCFAHEPLQRNSPLWKMPGVHITPHMSGATYATAAAGVLAENIQRLQQGETPFPLYRP